MKKSLKIKKRVTKKTQKRTHSKKNLKGGEGMMEKNYSYINAQGVPMYLYLKDKKEYLPANLVEGISNDYKEFKSKNPRTEITFAQYFNQNYKNGKYPDLAKRMKGQLVKSPVSYSPETRLKELKMREITKNKINSGQLNRRHTSPEVISSKNKLKKITRINSNRRTLPINRTGIRRRSLKNLAFSSFV